ncbi:protein-(glutamine-N5) methyltransferase [Hyphomicrobium nitrativorans NL23]|uniref:peptide chain release factor N(5)-glutamine methyltransferase n=1 Tax=Hyphomicrobium nitrativorans NL23 TaxID=1029756 RepID=V5SAI4_9HYPH|nr:peptide chain release factor N(5)-glutamine methyltransferase [Hyphomicrobium nitrativorans]AHB47653.1 protein-(glutamine-N5) methyltransferase [Hyphomicrobium nitrativorans NL23]
MGADRGVPPFAGMTVRDAQAALGRALGGAGIEDPAREARLLVTAALGETAEGLLRNPALRFDAGAAETLSSFAERRLAREPVSRILGARGFFGREFKVTPATLDPRPCTETVVEAALAVVTAEGWRQRPVRILDVGTGSGALLVTLLAELPLAVGVGTDVSDEALRVAEENAVRLGVASRASFLNRRDLNDIAGPFDLMVSNPPYIPSGDIAALEPEVRVYDPAGALDGGADGLAIYRALARDLVPIVPEGWALFEVGAGQAADVEKLLRDGTGCALHEVRTWQDLGQHTRCVAVKTQY